MNSLNVNSFVRNDSHPSSTRSKSSVDRAVINTMMNDFEPLDLSLWIHGVGYTKQFLQLRFSIMVTVLSICLSIIFDALLLVSSQDAFLKLYASNSETIKKYGPFLAANLTALSTRIWLYLHRRKLTDLQRKAVKIFATTAPEKILKLKPKLVHILVGCDVIAIFITIVHVLEVRKHENFQNIVDEFFHGRIPSPLSNWLFYICLFLNNWSFIPVVHVIVFYYFICFVLKESLKEYCKIIKHYIIRENNNLLEIHNDITDVVTSVNKLLHTPLILISIYMFLGTFYTVFNFAFFIPENKFEVIRKVLMLIWFDSFYMLACYSASMVSAAALEVKDLVHSLQNRHRKYSKILCLVLKVDDAVDFTLLDSITISNRMVLDIFGSIFTYGIMLATFDATQVHT